VTTTTGKSTLRPKLSLRSAADTPPPEPAVGIEASAAVIAEAIGNRRCITAVYNRAQMVVAPHVLYTRHDELFVDGVTLEQDSRKPRMTKISTYKLSGLTMVTPTRRLFAVLPEFTLDNPKYEDIKTNVAPPAA